MLEYLLFILGFLMLIKGADFLVDSSSSLAKKFKVSTLIIGLTIVAFGTSIPELLINIFSALKGAGDIAIGNVIGSNIANMLLVLGVTSIFYPIKTKNGKVIKEILFGILAAFVLLIVINDRSIDNIASSFTRSEGIILLLFFGVFLFYVFYEAKKRKLKIEENKIEIEEKKYHEIASLIILSIIFLYFGGRLVVDNALIIAQNLGISNFVISASIIALGTSLPELVTSLTAGAKKDLNLALGNIIGSNVFNIFWVLGITASITTIKIPELINFDIFFLVISSLLLFLFVLNKKEIRQERGMILVIIYIIYIIILIMRG